ncbi:hypothetical protein LZ757_05380 [Xylella fastidiosa subsp. morus]|uniref:hypothetical protein n=1 Tax=Xylella fastidiosa TaxID=2371 RepID=UPI0018AF7F16|nr:hypothetical protein [Xylella fastidiosa]UIN27889.1 hypothetical protein IUD23_11605 [Xylella fastidiosa subsp. morus]UIT37636.1 hypothetical protein LZ757_05380 [Xylella fastidiosa subsp. morus]UIT39928.1 hypothetical protein LZ755_05370 [Xylella fastidiosa subsp. morus]UIT44368.1 hypothetical protein LZ758_05330 [Xylella fastidiosa subsp. morus]
MRGYCDLDQLRTVYCLSDLCTFHTAMVEWDALQHDVLTPCDDSRRIPDPPWRGR